FSFLVTSLVTQALAAMGEYPDPLTGDYVLHLPRAKLHIDLLAMLQEKTLGHLTPDEAETLEQSVHQLRMLFVSRRHDIAVEQEGQRS
ncbi:MAG TPA: DUF1844 domain-containing protein, partial [Pirellulaceae bacterium]